MRVRGEGVRAVDRVEERGVPRAGRVPADVREDPQAAVGTPADPLGGGRVDVQGRDATARRREQVGQRERCGGPAGDDRAVAVVVDARADRERPPGDLPEERRADPLADEGRAAEPRQVVVADRGADVRGRAEPGCGDREVGDAAGGPAEVRRPDLLPGPGAWGRSAKTASKNSWPATSTSASVLRCVRSSIGSPSALVVLWKLQHRPIKSKQLFVRSCLRSERS